ncbi:hypothetical protein D3P08_21380 [Paenibacillus nanensis]|uniref:Copper chaperone n=1 Tax=Paenibacillus nanensis TaxID=393251 RepID=A0A3A1UP28_9BACL|nr:hypothetical protein [Paenibacillus nanensis]RIX50104.1 hypothetical protein D3P08_21380 [Paenibacillus nanensis]
MNDIKVSVGNLCACKEAAIRNAFAGRGALAAINVQEGMIYISYDSRLIYFVEMLEMIEEQGCSVKKLIK